MPTIIFDNLSSPNGVAFDSVGNLYISSLVSTSSAFLNIPPSIPAITKISPSGAIVDKLLLNSFAAPKLQVIPDSDILIALDENGSFSVIDSTNLSLINSFNLNSLPKDKSAVFDISTGDVGDFSALIPSGLSTFGDFDIRVTENSIQFFITGLSQAQAFPFVFRFDVIDGFITDPKVLFSSTADVFSVAPQSPRIGRGIAVNDQGVVLTTLPLPMSQQPIDFPLIFDADLDFSSGINRNSLFVLDQIDIYSQGMTTDALGNFYIATNSVGSGALGVAGEGALVVISSNFSEIVFAQGIGLVNSSFLDVAIDPLSGVPFVTVNDQFSPITGGGDFLVGFPEAIPQGQLTPTGLLIDDMLESDDLVVASATLDTELILDFPVQDYQISQLQTVGISTVTSVPEKPLEVVSSTPIQTPEAWPDTLLTL